MLTFICDWRENVIPLTCFFLNVHLCIYQVVLLREMCGSVAASTLFIS